MDPSATGTRTTAATGRSSQRIRGTIENTTSVSSIEEADTEVEELDEEQNENVQIRRWSLPARTVSEKEKELYKGRQRGLAKQKKRKGCGSWKGKRTAVFPKTSKASLSQPMAVAAAGATTAEGGVGELGAAGQNAVESSAVPSGGEEVLARLKEFSVWVAARDNGGGDGKKVRGNNYPKTGFIL